ncbi:MAG: SRPBCC family protein [Planctomycetota bacterium]
MTSNRTVDFKILVRAGPERVYDAIATTEGLNGWFTDGATVDARPGGRIHFRWTDHGVDHYAGENVRRRKRRPRLRGRSRQALRLRLES